MNFWQKILYWLGLYNLPAPVIPISQKLKTPIEQPTLPPNKTWGPAYDDIIKSKLSPAMMAYENEYFQPITMRMDDWWCTFMQAMVKTESNYDTNCVYQEKFIDDSTGLPCRSVGLAQMSLGDKFTYPDCPTLQLLTSEEQLRDPIFNLKCALEVMDSLIRRGKPLKSYWSSLDESKSGPETLATLKALLK